LHTLPQFKDKTTMVRFSQHGVYTSRASVGLIGEHSCRISVVMLMTVAAAFAPSLAFAYVDRAQGSRRWIAGLAARGLGLALVGFVWYPVRRVIGAPRR